MKILTTCAAVRDEFSEYLDGTMSGLEMQAMAAHLDSCFGCSDEFRELREMQQSLAELKATAPADLQARLRGAVSEERARGTHLAWHQRLARVWVTTLAPVALRAAMGTVATLLLVGGVSLLVMGTPTAVEANDEPLGAITAPHYLYSEVPPQAIDFGSASPILVEARIDDAGRVYDYTIVSGSADPSVERRVQANLLSSVFQPATVYGLAVPGRVMLTYSGFQCAGS